MFKAGTWKFIVRSTGAQTFVVVNDSSASKIQAAFVTASTALGGPGVDDLEGYDPAGHPVRYSSVRLNQRMV